VGETQALACLSGLRTKPEVLSLHPHRFADVLDDVVRIGEAAGVERHARDVVEEYRRRIVRVRGSVSGMAPVSIVVLEWIDPPYSCGHWTPDVVTMAGGRELLAGPGDRSRELAWDEVREADPEVIVLACCGQDVPKALEDLTHLETQEGFAELRAVRTGRVYAADGGAHFSRPGPRLVEALELLAGTLHGVEDFGVLTRVVQVGAVS
jgi:iron complex transport system substrate-binding protein